MSKRIPGMAARTTAVILVTLAGGGIIVGAAALSISFLQHHVDTIPAMMQLKTMAQRLMQMPAGDGTNAGPSFEYMPPVTGHATRDLGYRLLL